jgi:hypothetical protein
MKRLVLGLMVLLVACNATVDDEPQPTALSTATAAAIEHALEVSDLGNKELVYVAGPSLEIWDQWCGFDTGEPGEDPHDEIPACDVLDATSFDLPPVYPVGSESASEIEEALAPATVEFIEDPESVIEPFEEGMMVAPISNDAGLLIIGVLLEAEGNVYIAMDAHGQGWLLQLTPDQSDSGWTVHPIAEYIA